MLSGVDPITGQSRDSPETPALIFGERVVSWAQLDSRANQVARALRELGVSPADRVAVSLRNSVELFELVAGAGRLGATVVPVSFRFKRDEVEYMVADSRAVAVVAEPANRTEFAGLPGTIFRGDDYEAWMGLQPDGPLDDSFTQGLANLRYYTSGTTGRPKAIVRHETQEAAQVMENMTAARLGPVLGPGEVHLLAGVAYHTAPGAYATTALRLGHTVVITDHFDAEEALSLIERHQVTWTQMAPIHLVRIVALPEDVIARYDLGSIKRLMHAGAPCPVDVKSKVLDLFPVGSVYEYYAATEGVGTECPEELWRQKPGTVGLPLPGVRIHIIGETGSELPRGEVGQVYIHNGSRFEYEGAPDKTAETWKGDMFSVGDMGFLDAEGCLFLTDRKSHMIISGGANVYPAEVENVLYAHPAVGDVAVIGVPDAEFGEQVKAVVEARAPVTDTELIDFCRSRLSHYKCPRSVDFVEALPRDPNGKVRKRELREPYWKDRSTRI
jgi:long-chain acyl-CoA synthetase